MTKDEAKLAYGLVSLTVSLKWVAGFARLVEFAEPVSVVPEVNASQRSVHSVTAAPATATPPADTVTALTTLSDVHAAPVATSISEVVA